MKSTFRKARRFGVLTMFLFAVLVCSLFGVFFRKDGGRYALNVQAETEYTPLGYDSPSISIPRYSVTMEVHSDRTVSVREKITVQFLADGLSMFYRSLPKEGTRYYDITAACEGNEAFSYTVKENPDMGDFFDINCIGGTQKGSSWTYELSYTMIGGEDFGDGIIVDVIGFGWPVALHNVTATVIFPDAPLETPTLYVGRYGATSSESPVNVTYSQDGKSVCLYAEYLPLRYNDTYNESMAEGITLECSFAEGVFDSYISGRIFTKSMPWILLGGAICIGLSVVGVAVFRKKREIVSVVSVHAPKDMDPLKMGVWLDGTADNEDITSMLYYFADKGYLEIDFSDEDNPLLIKKQDVPQDMPIYAKTLFNGLFESGDAVHTSDLSERYYRSVQKAQMQVPKPSMYEGRSILGCLLGGVAATLYMLFTLFFMARLQMGGGYTYLWGGLFVVPVAAILFLSMIRENYRYKWKKSALVGSFVLLLAFAACGTLVFTFGTAKHIATEWEKLVVCVCGFTATILSTRAISRKEEYVRDLGEILGFKDFIKYAEEERLRALLEEEPQLFYSILPYAQVLGVSDIWEEKFRSLTIEPPTWCVGYRMSVFDYMLLNRCMRRSMARAMQPPQNSGSHAGYSGGGGHFGGFGGGGFGGGGGGAR